MKINSLKKLVFLSFIQNPINVTIVLLSTKFDC